MFPDSKIAANFSLSQVHHTLLEKVCHHTSQEYSLMTSSSQSFLSVFILMKQTQVKKQLDLTLRYWSTKHQKVWSMFYTSLFFVHAEGDKVAEKMFDSMLVDGLPGKKLATLIRDGPNVNKTIFRKVNERISQDHPNFSGLVDLGYCTIHMVHNAFGKALEQYGKDIDQLCTDLHSQFKYSATRNEDFKELQIEMDLELHNFHQHTEVQWLSIGPAIKRILEQWKAITQFVADLTKDPKKVPTGVSFKRVYAMIGTKEKAVTRVTLEFLNSVIPLFGKVFADVSEGLSSYSYIV